MIPTMSDNEERDNHVIEVPVGALKVQTFRAGIQQRYRKPNKRKYTVERRWGDDWYADGECWVTFERLIDKSRDLYEKRYVDQETGEIIYEVRERLSEHRSKRSDTNG